MNVWIDLANSPQVLFFRPLIPKFRELGHKVTVTTRHFAQTVELADHYGMEHVPIGGHGGKKLSKIGAALLERSLHLARFAIGKKFDIAISHNSYSQALASRLLGIPFLTSMDYEHQPANHICFRLAKKVIVPGFFPDGDLRRFGAGKKAVRYNGTKEEIYLSDFTPRSEYTRSLEMYSQKVVAVVRPPGSWGLYHHFDNPLFDKVFEYLVASGETQVIFLPRIDSQREAVARRGYGNVTIPECVLDGPNLMHFADLVVSGGGSMNREAAVLGTPTYSLFKGKLAAVDRYLMETGRMRHIDSDREIPRIVLSKKAPSDPTGNNSGSLIREVARLFLSN